jgi:sugar transferase (PEP-CTERM/EpsH1 system associated)
MNVLWLTYGLPFPADAGGRIRDFHLIREAARASRIHLFSLLPAGAPASVGELRDFCSSIETFPIPRFSPGRQFPNLVRSAWRRPVAALPYYSAAAVSRLRQVIEREKIEVFQIEHSLLAAYVDAVPRRGTCRTVLSLHNVCFEQYRQMAHLEVGLTARALYQLKAFAMRRAESHYLPQFDCCLVTSAADRELVQQLVPGLRSLIVENGVDCERLQPLPDSPSGTALLFAGVMDYPPNAEGAIFFARSVLPRIRSSLPDVRFLVVGHSPAPSVRALGQEPGIEVTAYVPDILPYYRRSRIVVVPLRAGGGTRLKILEAMALGRAVVSTSAGCAGLEVCHGVHLLVADDPRQFADCVLRVLKDNSLRAELTANARRLVEQHYDWAALGKRLNEAHRETLARPRNP